MDFEDEDEEFFNDPELHAQLDQVENQFIITQTQQQQQTQEEPPAKRPKLQKQSTKKQDEEQHQQELNRVKEQIEQIRIALKESEREKQRLQGQVSIIKSQLETSKTTSTQQLTELKRLEQQLKTRAERAEQQLARIESQRNLKETFKGLEESAKKQQQQQPSSSASTSLLRKTLLTTTTATTTTTTTPTKNNRKLVALQQSFTPQHAPSSSFNQNDQSTQPPQNSPARPHPRPSISFLEPPPPSASPFSTSQQQNPSPSSPQSSSPPLGSTGPPANHPYELIHTVIVRLFQSFMVTLIEEDSSTKKSGGKETKEEGGGRSGMTIGATLQTILNASNQLEQASQPGLKATFDGLVMELFGILANASDPDTFQIPPPSCSSSSSTARPSQTLLSLLSAPSISNTHLLAADDNDEDARVLAFVVRIGSLFVQICALLSRTDLIEAQTEAIHILTILVQVSPLFVSLFLSHPDFDARRTPSSHPIFPPAHPPPPAQGEEEGDLLVVILTLFENLDRIRNRHFKSSTPPSSSTAEDSISLTLPFPPPPSSSAPGNLNQTVSSSSVGLHSLFCRRLHTALLDLLSALVWDPAEACYPTLEKFLKSNGQSIFQYLLVIPYYHNQQQTTGTSKPLQNDDEEDDDGLILTEKSIDVLFSLASRVEFSKIILEARVQESIDPMPSQPNPTNSTPNVRNQQRAKPGNVGSKTNGNPRPTVPVRTPVEGRQTEAEKTEESSSSTVVDRIMKLYLVTATNQESDSRGNRKIAEDPDRHSLKLKILSFLHLLAITHRPNPLHLPPSEERAAHEWDGWQALASAGSSLFSSLIKTVFVDAYRLWNLDGTVYHRLLVPRLIERIELSVQILHKTLYPQSSSSSTSTKTNAATTRTPMCLVSRLKQESPHFAATLSSLSTPRPNPSSSSSSSTSTSSSVYFRPIVPMIIGTHNNIYHEFIVCFSKLSWLDYLNPFSTSTSNQNHQHHNQNQNEDQNGDDRIELVAAFPFPWDPPLRHFGHVFNRHLDKHVFFKLDLIADLAYDILSAVASPDELEEWRLCSIDDDSGSDDDDDDDDDLDED
ncbi:hypothetical protein PGT21_015051 [Puccinia graminis f. sp. tritici]|uniref:Uncharacterized protein n=1 Tax=Puccinia graminis f. sp. tritici TaxID=56615 RepID=A0A5B0P1H4_PUCGR|nr:hypothetical protein PGTUg99_020329 [Puccinia graminis f. sp. tritici]KAA1094250.1 hypothetical protein PGT21_015051 [Puccinia graminis f. sp. tritici]